MKTVRIEVGGKTVHSPVFEDVHTTRELAKQVTERLKAIESESDRIDTQAFALTAAISFAHEASRLRNEQEADTQDILKALDELTQRLRKLESKHGT